MIQLCHWGYAGARNPRRSLPEQSGLLDRCRRRRKQPRMITIVKCFKDLIHKIEM